MCFISTEQYKITGEWKANSCKLKLKNLQEEAVRLYKTPVLEMPLFFAPDTPVYGEGYSKLCQYRGTVTEISTQGCYGDADFYKLAAPEGCQQVYHMVLFTPDNEPDYLMGFASCRRFCGEFWLDETKATAVLNLEGICILPQETIELEYFFADFGNSNELLKAFAQRSGENHPALNYPSIPTGWCSWLVYGPSVTMQNVYDNMDAIKERGLELTYIQIDDGYQNHMGDWLTESETFQGGIRKLCLDIRDRGFEPAIWVAPFIADKDSCVLKEHPGWFVQDENGCF